MRVALDIDGVLYHWERTARYMLRTYCGETGPGVEQVSEHWDWISDQVRRSSWKWLWTEGVKLGLFRYGHVMKDAIVGVNQLAGAGHHLIVVTHRPPQAVNDTIDWLSYVRFPIDGIHVLTDGQNKSTVDFDVIVDDKVQNVRDAWNHYREGILFDQPWNGKYDVPNRAYGWLGDEGVVAKVRAL